MFYGLAYLFTFLSAGLTAGAFLNSTSPWASVLSASGALFLILSLYSRRDLYLRMLLFGVLLYTPSFYWLPATLSSFGGFPRFVSLILYLIFVLLSSLQFVLFAYLLDRVFKHWSLAFGVASAYFISEFLFPKLFPWRLAHPQIYFSDFAMLARLFGVEILGFVMLVAIASSICLFKMRARSISAWLSLGVLSLMIYYNNNSYQLADKAFASFALVQGNLDVHEKGDIHSLSSNLSTYQRLSEQSIYDMPDLDLIIWPETVFNSWIDLDAKNSFGQILLKREDSPYPDSKKPLLFGGLSYKKKSPSEIDAIKASSEELGPKEIEFYSYHKYNSVLMIDQGSKILSYYHKKALMPLGEYLPFADTFPWIRKLSPQSGDFSKGEIPPILELPRSEDVLKIAPLVCYEDLISSISVEGVRKGAQVLVNFTNDAWYGDTQAPYQHNLLASWRAIETGRPMLRVTNTGFTSAIDIQGRVRKSLPLFEEGFLSVSIGQYSDITPYLRCADWINWALLIFLISLAFATSLIARTKADLSKY